MLAADPAALAAASFLVFVLLVAIFGPMLVGKAATSPNMTMRNVPPHFTTDWLYLLGGDNLGRSVVARLLLGARTTLSIAASAVVASLVVGAAFGLVAGFRGGLLGDVIMRLTDIIMSFPSLLSALVVLYVLGPGVTNLVIVLAITRIPVYLRTVRAEVLEVKRRPFVAAAESMGATPLWIVRHHLLPIVLPTLITIAAIDFAAVIIAESGLSFLGLGIQPPDFTWGSMVAVGRTYMAVAPWLSLVPGIAILLTTLSLTILSNWLRLANDPNQRWRFDKPRKAKP
jgi:peptide/nickel transport system permease protein